MIVCPVCGVCNPIAAYGGWICTRVVAEIEAERRDTESPLDQCKDKRLGPCDLCVCGQPCRYEVEPMPLFSMAPASEDPPRWLEIRSFPQIRVHTVQ